MANYSRYLFVCTVSFCLLCLVLNIQAAVDTSLITSKIETTTVPFIANLGQLDDDVSFYASTLGGTLFVTHSGDLVYDLPKIEDIESVKWDTKQQSGYSNGVVLKECFVDASISHIESNQEATAKINIFKGKDQNKWRNGINTYNQLNLGEIYEGIELYLKAHGNNVEKIFHVTPGADPNLIKVSISGATGLEVNDVGQLEVSTSVGSVHFTKPVAWQEVAGKRVSVSVSYEIVSNNQGLAYIFHVGSYNKSSTLIIDPLLASTYFGGSGIDKGHSIAIDNSGNVLLMGESASNEYPTTLGAYDRDHNGNIDIVVSKLSPDLSTLIESTYLGGVRNDVGNDIKLDRDGNVLIVGSSQSPDYPTTTDAYDRIFDPPSYSSSTEIVISKLSSDLSSLIASTYLGAFGHSEGSSITIDNLGNIIVAGITLSPDYPTTTGAYDRTQNGSKDIVISKLSSNLSSLIASTFLGGGGSDEVFSITYDAEGNVNIVGNTIIYDIDDYPTTYGAYDTTYNGGHDIILSKVSSDLSTLLSSTYFGGNYHDYGTDIKLDSGGNVFIVGHTHSSDYPVTSGSYDNTYNSTYDIVISKLSSDFSTLLASTYFGGTGQDGGTSISIDGLGNIVIAGNTNSRDFPTTIGAYDLKYDAGGANDLYISKFSADLSSLIASTYLGGTDSEYGSSIFIDNFNNIFVTATSNSQNFPTTTTAYSQVHTGAYDTIVSKLILPDVTQWEQWSLVFDNGEGEGVLFLSISPDGTVGAEGNWTYTHLGTETTGAYVLTPATIDVTSVSLVVSGIAIHPPYVYDFSSFTLSIMGDVLEGVGSGTFTISFQEAEWAENISGTWRGTRTRGRGITPEICDIGYCEDFNSEPIDFTENPYFSVSGDRLHFTGDPALTFAESIAWNGGLNPGGKFPLPGNSNYFENYVVSVDTFWEARAIDWPYGLLVCGPKSGSTNCIGHRVNKDERYSIGRSLGGIKGFITPHTYSSLMKEDGQNNNLSIKKVGPYFYFYLNGVEVQRRNLDYFYGGNVGLYAFHPVDASFDNFAVSEIGYEAFEDDSNNVVEDFDISVGGFFEAPYYEVSNGRLHFQGDRTDYMIYSEWNGGFNPGGLFPTVDKSNYFVNFTVSADTHWEGGNDYDPYGLFVCSQNSIDLLDSVEFYISDDGWYFIRKAQDGAWETLIPWAPSTFIATGGSNNTLEIQKNGTQFVFSVNGQELETLAIGGYPGGGIGFVTSEYVDVSFDDFTIIQPGTPPTADAGLDQDVTEGLTVTLDGSNSSDDNSITTYRWYQLAGPQVTLSDSSVAQPNFTAPDVMEPNINLAFQLKVTDGDRLHDSDITLIKVKCEDIAGDVDGSCIVDLRDTIVSLQAVAGRTSADVRSDYVSSGVDINGNNKVGTAEAIHALQKSAEL